MRPMAIDRRSLLLGAAAGALAGLPAHAGLATPTLYAAARKGADGHYSVAAFTADGRDVRALALPGRGHDVTVSPDNRWCVVFARRPGSFAVAFSPDNRHAPLAFTTPPDRHFYGHGVFSRDGRLLYATENDFDGARGVIGIYDVGAGFRRVGEFSSGGVGPHDLALLQKGRVLVVANGGLREHPDFGGGRRILNPDAIATTLAYIDLGAGALLERHDLGVAGALSLRHLDVARDDTVIIGAQLTRGAADGQSLIYRHRRQGALAAIALPAEVEAGLSGYVSSIACDRTGEFAAVTSSRGALAAVIDIASGRVVCTRRLEDVSGVAPTGGPAAFLTTSGLGRVSFVSDGSTADQSASTPWAWDNHAVMIAGDPIT
jgi:uncharacterized protein